MVGYLGKDQVMCSGKGNLATTYAGKRIAGNIICKNLRVIFGKRSDGHPTRIRVHR